MNLLPLQGRVSTNEGDIAALEAADVVLADADAALAVDIAALESADDALEADITALEAEDASLAADITALQAEDTSLAADITALEARPNVLVWSASADSDISFGSDAADIAWGSPIANTLGASLVSSGTEIWLPAAANGKVCRLDFNCGGNTIASGDTTLVVQVRLNSVTEKVVSNLVASGVGANAFGGLSSFFLFIGATNMQVRLRIRRDGADFTMLANRTDLTITVLG